PSVPAPGEVEIAGREALINDRIADQRRSPVQSFEQVMAEKCILGNAPFEAPMKGRHIIEALAHVDACAEQVLIDVGYGARIDIDGRVAPVEARKQGLAGRFRRQLNARLKNRISSFDRAGRSVEVGAVK